VRSGPNPWHPCASPAHDGTITIALQAEITAAGHRQHYVWHIRRARSQEFGCDVVFKKWNGGGVVADPLQDYGEVFELPAGAARILGHGDSTQSGIGQQRPSRVVDLSAIRLR
jgi:hypothetical protein